MSDPRPQKVLQAVTFLVQGILITVMELNSFPGLQLISNDVTGSWNDWLAQFEITVELTTLNLGKETVEGVEVNKFRGRTKLLAFLSAIGNDGRANLQSLGFDLRNNDNEGYEQALYLLRGHYDRKDSFYVKTMRFATGTQANHEDEREYLLGVEKLSRELGLGARIEDVRRRLCVALAVNGLHDTNARKQLLQESWDNLNTKLKAKKLARDSDLLLSEARAIANVKQEVGAVSSPKQTRNSSSDTCDSSSVNRVSRSSLRNSDHYRSRSTSRSSNSSGEDSKRHHNSRDKFSSSQRSRRDLKPFVSRQNTGYYDFRSNRFSSLRREGIFAITVKKHDYRIRDCPDVRCFICNHRGHTTKDCLERKAKP